MREGRGTARADTLFVYGTLMRASSHPMATKLNSQSQFIGPGWVSAKLYSLGSYPGAVPSQNSRDRVHGEAVRLLNPALSLAWLDRYEGCHEGAPEPQAYERVIMPVTFESGGQLDAWVYLYKLPVASARHLPEGRFIRD